MVFFLLHFSDSGSLFFFLWGHQVLDLGPHFNLTNSIWKDHKPQNMSGVLCGHEFVYRTGINQVSVPTMHQIWWWKHFKKHISNFTGDVCFWEEGVPPPEDFSGTSHVLQGKGTLGESDGNGLCEQAQRQLSFSQREQAWASVQQLVFLSWFASVCKTDFCRIFKLTDKIYEFSKKATLVKRDMLIFKASFIFLVNCNSALHLHSLVNSF